MQANARTGLTLVVLMLLGGCGQPEVSEPIPFKPTGDVKHTMVWVLDPAADVIWGATGSIITVDGTEDLTPTTEEGWLAVQHSATVVAEAGNLLLMPSLARDEEGWREISLGLIDVGVRAARAAEEHDAEALFDVGGQLYRVCVSCHTIYDRPEQNDTAGE